MRNVTLIVCGVLALSSTACNKGKGKRIRSAASVAATTSGSLQPGGGTTGTTTGGGTTATGDPRLTAVTPDTGSTLGGTQVTIQGERLQDGAIVYFDGDVATNVVVTSPTELTCETPAHAAGLVDVEVYLTKTNQVARLNNAFTFGAGGNGALARLADYGDPSPADQELLELMNSARKDPVTAGRDLGLTLDPNQYPPRQPLCHNRQLGEAAHAHSKNMAKKGEFNHVVDGVGPNGRLQGVNYPLHPVYGTSRVQNFTEIIVAGAANSRPAPVSTPLQAYRVWMIDANQSPPKHRDAILGRGNVFGAAREAGVGFDTGLTSPLGIDTWVTAELARTRDDKPFLTGVVYDDASDPRYEMGEGRGGVQVTLAHASGFTLPTATATAGGYGFEILVPGDYDLTIDGETTQVQINQESVKVDLRGGQIVK